MYLERRCPESCPMQETQHGNVTSALEWDQTELEKSILAREAQFSEQPVLDPVHRMKCAMRRVVISRDPTLPI